MPYRAKSRKLKGNHLHVRSGDTVMVMAGKDKGRRGKILVAFPSTERVIVENINMQTRHQKPRGVQSPGGKIEREGAIHVSNVLLLCQKCGKPTRVGHKILDNGDKLRMCKKCGETFDN